MSNKIKIAFSGLPGRMASAVAELALKKNNEFEVAQFALTGPNMASSFELSGNQMELISSENINEFIGRVKSEVVDIIIDYSHPSAVETNVIAYTENKLPFILGTTGGDYSNVEKKVLESGVAAIVAPNMALPIVAITAMLEMCQNQFPGVFENYQLTVKESHQKGKADTSGTAKHLISFLQNAGADFEESKDLSMCRDPDEQKSHWGIPDEYLTGHAFHTYDLRSSDETSHFSLSHNILGRNIYAEGTLEAVKFLYKRRDTKCDRSYNMIDVLKNLRTENV